MTQNNLLLILTETTFHNISKANFLKTLPDNVLKYRKAAHEWNILECIEHLNLYASYYHQKIKEAVNISKNIADGDTIEYKSGLLGGYFAKSMLPKEKINKMNTFKDKNPIHYKLERDVIDKFIALQNDLISLLHQSKNINVNKIKIPITILPMVKIRLGDTFQFVINHNTRHFSQIEKILEKEKEYK